MKQYFCRGLYLDKKAESITDSALSLELHIMEASEDPALFY